MNEQDEKQELEPATHAANCIVKLARIQAELDQYRKSPSPNAGYFVLNVEHILEDKP